MDIEVNDSFPICVTHVSLAHRKSLCIPYEFQEYRARRGTWGISCALTGCCEIQHVNGETQRITAGDMALIPPESSYVVRIGLDSQGRPAAWDHYTINFDAVYAPGILRDMSRALIVRPIRLADYEKLFSECIFYWMEKKKGYMLQMISRISLITAEILRLADEEETTLSGQKMIAPAYRHILEHFDSRLTMEDLAARSNLSVSHFRRLFKHVYGMTPTDCLLMVRLEKAKELLSFSSLHIREVAQNVGFQNLSYFVRFFEKKTGVSPSEYRDRR